MVTWMPIKRAPKDGRWIVAINRHEPDRRAVIRWDPDRFGNDQPRHVSTGDQSYRNDAYTDWIPVPHCPLTRNEDHKVRTDV